MKNVLLFITTVISVCRIGNSTNFENLSEEELISKCSFQGDMCAIGPACFVALYNNKERTLLEECITPPNAPKKSLYAEELLSFKPDIRDEYFFMPSKVTYSVLVSNYDLDFVEPLPGCCNLDPNSNDTCKMPATFDKDKRFMVVFPYNDMKSELYCRIVVQYSDLPMEFCEDGQEIIDPCIFLEDDGTFRIKHRYTPFSDTTISDEIKTQRCYFPLPEEVMPQDKAYATGDFIPNDEGFVIMKPPTAAMVRGETEYSCELHDGVTKAIHGDITASLHDAGGGDFVCCGIKRLDDPSKYYNETYCTDMRLPSVPILAIALPLAAFLLLLILIISVKGYQQCKKVKKAAEQANPSTSLRIQLYEKDQEKGKTIAADEELQKEEVDKVELGAVDDTCSTKPAIPPEAFENDLDKCDDDHEYKFNETGSYIKKNVLSEETDDSGFSDMSADTGHYCPKLSPISPSEPICESYEEGHGGYMAKPTTFGISGPCTFKNHGVSDEVTYNEANQPIECGYTPKFIKKPIS